MVWFERDLLKRDLRPVKAGTRRSFGSRFHNPGQPQVEVIYADEHKAQIMVPEIFIGIGDTVKQPLEKIVERQSFTLRYQNVQGGEEIFYESIYSDSK